MPTPADLDTSGLGLSEATMDELLAVDAGSWLAECDLTQEYFTKFGDHLPSQMLKQLDDLRARLTETS
jgi:phosphoenolpyruvate carboxykinase (GTP)